MAVATLSSSLSWLVGSSMVRILRVREVGEVRLREVGEVRLRLWLLDDLKSRAGDGGRNDGVRSRVLICHGDRDLVNANLVHLNVSLVKTIALWDGNGCVKVLPALPLILFVLVEADQGDSEVIAILRDHSSIGTSTLKRVNGVVIFVDDLLWLALDS